MKSLASRPPAMRPSYNLQSEVDSSQVREENRSGEALRRWRQVERTRKGLLRYGVKRNSLATQTCPTGCSGRGMYTSAGTCDCEPGYTGIDCSAASCDEQCSLHGGVCDNGVCEFRSSDYAGYTCQHSSLSFLRLSMCGDVLVQEAQGQHCAPSEPNILQ